MGYYKDQLITQDCYYHEVQAYLLIKQILDYKGFTLSFTLPYPRWIDFHREFDRQ